jgi:hypothetical protein
MHKITFQINSLFDIFWSLLAHKAKILNLKHLRWFQNCGQDRQHQPGYFGETGPRVILSILDINDLQGTDVD